MLPVTKLKSSSGKVDCSRRLILWNSAIPPLCIHYIYGPFISWSTDKKGSLHTMSLPNDQGWQLSKLNVPAVVARTWALQPRQAKSSAK